ncbi:MAG: RNA polymerase sigma factor [Candidatus Dormibacteria bacterium]
MLNCRQIAPLSNSTSDVELVQAFQGGSAAAFDQLFLRYHQSISGLALRLVRDPLLAEDLTQETFFRVLRSLDRVDESFNFSAWVHRIATNLCYDELRRRKRGASPQAEHEGPRVTQMAAGVEDPDEVLAGLASKDMTERPEEALAMRELRREVWDVAARLPEKYRRILTLRELQGLSYSAIAEVMELSESAVETLLHRARRRFKSEYLYQDFAAAEGAEKCAALAELLQGAGLTGLRRRQKLELVQHASGCARCEPLRVTLGSSRSSTPDPDEDI